MHPIEEKRFHGQITGTNVVDFGKSVDFWVYFGPKTSNIGSKVLKTILKVVPPSCQTPYYTKTLEKSSQHGP